MLVMRFCGRRYYGLWLLGELTGLPCIISGGVAYFLGVSCLYSANPPARSKGTGGALLFVADPMPCQIQGDWRVTDVLSGLPMLCLIKGDKGAS